MRQLKILVIVIIALTSITIAQNSVFNPGSGGGSSLPTPVSLANGGTNAALTAANGAIPYSTGSALALLAPTATANQLLQSGASGAPQWSTVTIPATVAINSLLYTSAANVMTQLTAGSNTVLVSSAGDVPSFSGTLPSGVMATITRTGLIATYNGVATAGNGIPSIQAWARTVAATGALASIATYTLPAADHSFIVSSNILITASTTFSFGVVVTYTDEGNTSRNVTFNFTNPAGVISPALINTGGTGPYDGLPIHIRCKASTVITISAAGTFTTVTYNAEGLIQQVD